jgi:hypothetical protein
MNITLLGDLWPLDTGEVDIPDFARGTDLCLANLEGPMYTGNASPWPKAGPALRGSARILECVRPRFGPLVLSLANNHTMDYGLPGLRATVHTCQALGVDVVGAGDSLSEAQAPRFLDIKGVRVAIVARCETQFGGAGPSRPGVANIEDSLCQRVHDLSREADAVVVTIHGGSELSPWPSPAWQARLRALVDAGATIVHGHHSHTPQGYETYGNGVIVYGPGNFVVDPDMWGGDPYHPHALWSLAVECSLESSPPEVSVRTLVVESGPTGPIVRYADNGQFRGHRSYLARCNEALSDPALLEALWQETAVRMYELFYSQWLGHPSPRANGQGRRPALAALRRAAADLVKGPRPLEHEELLLHYHVFSCESHRDAISTALGVLSGEKEDLRSERTRALADEFMPWSVPGLTEMYWGGPGRVARLAEAKS